MLSGNSETMGTGSVSHDRPNPSVGLITLGYRVSIPGSVEYLNQFFFDDSETNRESATSKCFSTKYVHRARERSGAGGAR